MILHVKQSLHIYAGHFSRFQHDGVMAIYDEFESDIVCLLKPAMVLGVL